MYNIGDIVWVEYHSKDWELMTALGFTTLYVDDNDRAKMLKVR